MSTKKEVLLTREGLTKIEQELELLKTKKRPEVVQRLKAARAQGDLSENSEYDAAKEEQTFTEERIVALENIIRNAKLITAENLDKNVVSVGSTVTIQELPDKELEKYIIVGSPESDPANGKISNESPIGMAIIGTKSGDLVNINTPDGLIKIKVLKIE
ncbi:MAG: transcription elongation factor GreA [Bacillota bacterium]